MGLPSNLETEIAGYASGAADVAEINVAIETAWATVLADPASRAEAAGLLGLAAADLPARSPFVAKPAEAGLADAAIAIFVTLGGFAGSVATDLAKDLVKDAIKAGTKAVWEKLLKARAEESLPTGGIGPEVVTPDDVQ